MEKAGHSVVNRTPECDPRIPSSAGIWNYLYGGKDHHEADREVAHRMLDIAPDAKTTVWLVRQFLVRAVELAARAGVQQFLDLGTGFPASPTVHEIARRIKPSARVVYIDNDAVVRAHCDALLARTRGLSALQADLRRPSEIIDRLTSQALIDFREPIAVIMVGVLDHVMDQERPAGIVAVFRDAMAPGSYLALTHGSDETNADLIIQSESDTQETPAQLCYRSPAEIEKLTAGFELLPPGIAPVQTFLEPEILPPTTRWVICGGLAHKPPN